MTHKKVWVDGLDGPVECIGCGRNGRAVALGHGNQVSLADQITICMYFPGCTLAQLYNAIIQLRGRVCERFPTLLVSQTILWSHRKLDLFTSSATAENLFYLSSTTVLCKAKA